MTDRKIIRRFPAGEITPPPSKSLSHRALICAALAARRADTASRIYNLGQSVDIAATQNGLREMGSLFRSDEAVLEILPSRAAASGMIDCAESGSTLRFLIPIAALEDFRYRFTGRGRLLQRPLDIYRDIFGASGLLFERDEQAVTIRGPLRGGRFTLPGDVSSQFVSGLLFALPLLAEDSEIALETPLESRAYVQLTLDVMRHFGVRIEETQSGYRIPGGQRYRATDYAVEADYSQAAFLLAAAALGRPVACRHLNPNSTQGDRAILDVLQEMGAKIEHNGDVTRVFASELRAVTVDAREIPDLVPVIAALCCFCGGESRIENAARVRLKESDRLHAICTELRALGADIEELPDGLVINGKPALNGGVVDAHGDHRIAMALAVAAIRCKQPVELSGYQSVEKSYPRFWEDFEQEERVWRQPGDEN